MALWAHLRLDLTVMCDCHHSATGSGLQSQALMMSWSAANYSVALQCWRRDQQLQAQICISCWLCEQADCHVPVLAAGSAVAPSPSGAQAAAVLNAGLAGAALLLLSIIT